MPNGLIVLCFACLVSGAAAQESGPPASSRPIAPSYARAVWAPPVLPESREPLGGLLGPGDEDHRYAGFFVGAALGLAATLYSVAWCEDPDNSCSASKALIMGPVASAMLAFGGAVIGGLIPKAP
jgi:hypothetical protein